MSNIGNSEFIAVAKDLQRKFSYFFNLDLKDAKNKGNIHYDNYQLLLLNQSNNDTYSEILEKLIFPIDFKDIFDFDLMDIINVGHPYHRDYEIILTNPANSETYEEAFARLLLSLDYKRLFKFNLLDNKNIGHPFYDDYQLLLMNHSNIETYNEIYGRLYLQVGYMKILEKNNYEGIEFLKNRLSKNKNNVGFYGDKFEMFILYSFYLKSISFIKHESPDFIINFKEKTLYIECTSVQFDFGARPQKKNIFSKLTKTIRGKLRKPYANKDTALLIDITNLRYHAQQLGEELTHEEVLFTLDRSLEGSRDVNAYGEIVFFYLQLCKDDLGRESYLWKSQGNAIIGHNKELADFIKSLGSEPTEDGEVKLSEHH